MTSLLSAVFSPLSPLATSLPGLSVVAMGPGIEFGLLIATLAVDLVAIAAIMIIGYYRSSRNASYLFTLVLVNVLVLLVTHLMLVADLSAGVGFGMFALFGIIRFRTATLPVQEMTYLFTAIVVAVINGVSVDLLAAWELGVLNAIAVIAVIGLSGWADSKPRTLSLLYDRVENLPVERRADLIADLEQRIGETILDVSVVRVNLLNDTAELLVSVGSPVLHGRPIDLPEVASSGSPSGVFDDADNATSFADQQGPGGESGRSNGSNGSNGSIAEAQRGSRRLLHWTVGSR